MNFRLMKINELCEVNPSKSVSLSADTFISFLPMTAVSVDGKIDLREEITVGSVKNYTVFRDGDILFAKITPCMENGKGAIVYGLKNGWGAGSSEFIVLRPNPHLISAQWLQLFLMQKSFRLYCQQHMTGSAGQKRVPAKFLAQCEIPVPSLAEQERIVARIEELFSELDSGVETLKTVKAQLKVYRQAVLKEAFSEITDYVGLASICERVFDGPFGSNLKTADYTDAGIRVVRLENIRYGWFDNSKKSFITQEKYEVINNHTVYPSDLIMSTFMTENIKICYLPKDIEFAVNKADCIGIRLKKEYLMKYVMFYLMTKAAYNSLVNEIHGATRPRVNTKQIKNLKIPMCNKIQQKYIVDEIESRFSVCDEIEQTVDTALQKAEALRQSILKKTFEGRLV